MPLRRGLAGDGAPALDGLGDAPAGVGEAAGFLGGAVDGDGDLVEAADALAGLGEAGAGGDILAHAPEAILRGGADDASGDLEGLDERDASVEQHGELLVDGLLIGLGHAGLARGPLRESPGAEQEQAVAPEVGGEARLVLRGAHAEAARAALADGHVEVRTGLSGRGHECVRRRNRPAVDATRRRPPPRSRG